MKKAFYLGIFLCLAFVFAVSNLKIANACATIDEYVIETSREKGSFEMPRKYFNWAQLDFPRDKYPGKIEVYFDGEKLNELKNYPDGVSFQMGDHFPQSYRTDGLTFDFTNTVSVRILQDGKEFYSAKWEIHDVNRNKYLLDFMIPFIILFLIAVTFFAVIWAILSNLITTLERWRIKAWMFIPLLILDIIAIIVYVSSQSLLC
jgi:hypothetical protein